MIVGTSRQKTVKHTTTTPYQKKSQKDGPPPTIGGGGGEGDYKGGAGSITDNSIQTVHKGI